MAHTDPGLVCGDNGWQHLSKKECNGKETLDYAKSLIASAKHTGMFDSPSLPKGCFLLTDGKYRGNVRWNLNEIGTNNHGARNICRKGNL